MIDIEIDGRKLSAEPGSTIIQVADAAGIYIPRFCYHAKLSVAANCRMCLVEVEKAPKTLPACATPITPDMKVFTRSEKSLASQRTVMEFLLINHPLDCPICDQGGECELQDLAMGYGRGVSRYTEGKRSVHDEDLGPLVATEMTRCIQCTRCVRFGDEVAGLPELARIGRGEDYEIGTYIGHMMQSELSGNIIDLCPVGALTSKPYRFKARAWELNRHAAIAPHDCIGSNIYLHTRTQEYNKARHVMRAVPRDNEAINEIWISDRDRYSYEAVSSPERLSMPLVKYNGNWQEVNWDIALAEAGLRLQRTNPEQIAALTSSSATLEEMYLLQKIMRGLGSPHIDHRSRQSDFRDQEQAPLYPTLGMPIADLDKLEALLLVGSNVRHEQPIAALRIRKAVKQGAQVMCVNPIDYPFSFAVSETCIAGDQGLAEVLAKILKALSIEISDSNLPAQLTTVIANVTHGQAETAIAKKLLAAKNAAVVLGAYADQHPQAAVIRLLTQWIARLTQATWGNLTEGANSAGAWLAGAVPHRGAAGQSVNLGLNARDMFAHPRQAYLLLGIEPELDNADAAVALNALRQAETVIVLSSFRDGASMDYADIILPIATFAETAGTYINAEGSMQSMSAATPPMGTVRPAWEVLQQLANQLELVGINYTSSESIRDEVLQLTTAQATTEHGNNILADCSFAPTDKLYRIAQWPMYRSDSLVRRARALQQKISDDIELASIGISPILAKRLDLQAGMLVTATQGQSRVTLPLIIDARIADNLVAIPAALEVTAGFGDACGEIKLEVGE